MPNNTGPIPADAGQGQGIPGLGIATQVGQSALGQAMGMIFGGAQDKRQLRQAEKLQNLQIVGQKHMMDYSYDKQLQMWKDTNYSAQVEQMKLAGINPGLLYGMSGGGGTTTGSSGGASPSGHQAAGMTGEGIMLGKTIMELGLQKAQKELIEAQTAKTNTETAKIGGVDTKLGETQIASLTQGIQNQKAVERLTDVQTELAQLDTKYSRDTLEERIGTAETLYYRGLTQYEIEKRQNRLSEAQFNDNVQLLKWQVAKAAAETALTDAKTKTEQLGPLKALEEINLMISTRLQNWRKIGQTEEQINLNRADQLLREIPDPLRDLLGNLGIFVAPAGGGTRTPIRGLHQR